MKTKTLLLAIIAILFIGGAKTYAQSQENKMLIVYFSWSSNGNTRNVAEQIETLTGADIFEIVPEQAYPSDYKECVDQAKIEINDNFKPEIKGKVTDFDSYDIIFVGSPNWWNTIAPPVATFFANYDFSDKTIIPFITHGSSGLGRSVDDMKKLCPDATILSALLIKASEMAEAGSEVQQWLKDLNVIK